MRASLVKIAGLAGAAMFVLSGANAASTLIPVPPFTGGTTTDAFGINDGKSIAGSYLGSDGIQHGFVGTLKGTYTSFDYSNTGVTATQGRALDNNGDVTGYALAPSKLVGFEWERVAAGTIFTINGKTGKALDGIAQQIQDSGKFTGDYTNNKGRFAYLGQTWALKKTLPIQFGGIAMAGRGINRHGSVVGWFEDTNAVQHGFTLIGGTYTQVDYPGGQALTVLEGINDKGLIVGQFKDSGGITRSFKLTSTGTFTELKVPNAASFTQAFGVNNAGWVTLLSDQGAFVYCPHGKAQCKAADSAVEVADGPSIHKPAGSFVVFDPKKVAKTFSPVKLPKGAAAL